MNKIIDRIEEGAKAVVGVVTPIISATVTDVLLELSKQATVGIAALATGALVWWTKNKPQTDAARS